MTKEDWYRVGLNKYKASTVLAKENCYHNSVYLGGYVLESYFKLILIINGWDAADLYVHLNKDKQKNKTNGTKKLKNFLYKEVNNIYQLNPEWFDGFDFDRIKNLSFGDNKWNVEGRYSPDKWNDKDFCIKVVDELDYIIEKFNYLKIEGELR